MDLANTSSHDAILNLLHIWPTSRSLIHFRANIAIMYTRWATISHATKEEAEADNKFYLANYDSRRPQIAWYDSPADAASFEKQARAMSAFAGTGTVTL